MLGIDENIPVPGRAAYSATSNVKIPWLKMKVDESVLLPRSFLDERRSGYGSRAVTQANKRHPDRLFKAYRTADGVRIFRLK